MKKVFAAIGIVLLGAVLASAADTKPADPLAAQL